MVSLLISRLGKVVSAHTPEASYDALKKRGYLSDAGLARRDVVIALLKQVLDSWPRDPAIGAEPWRHMEAALAEAGLLSAAGLDASRQYVSRN